MKNWRNPLKRRNKASKRRRRSLMKLERRRRSWRCAVIAGAIASQILPLSLDGNVSRTLHFPFLVGGCYFSAFFILFVTGIRCTFLLFHRKWQIYFFPLFQKCSAIYGTPFFRHSCSVQGFKLYAIIGSHFKTAKAAYKDAIRTNPKYSYIRWWPFVLKE